MLYLIKASALWSIFNTQYIARLIYHLENTNIRWNKHREYNLKKWEESE